MTWSSLNNLFTFWIKTDISNSHRSGKCLQRWHILYADMQLNTNNYCVSLRKVLPHIFVIANE